MASAEIVVNALRDIKDKKELDRYDESLCRDIQQRLDSKLKENNMSISEKSIFVIGIIISVKVRKYANLSSKKILFKGTKQLRCHGQMVNRVSNWRERVS